MRSFEFLRDLTRRDIKIQWAKCSAKDTPVGLWSRTRTALGSSTSPHRVTSHRFVPENQPTRRLLCSSAARKLLRFRASTRNDCRVTIPGVFATKTSGKTIPSTNAIYNFTERTTTWSSILARAECRKNLRGGSRRHKICRYLFSSCVWADTCLTLSGFPRHIRSSHRNLCTQPNVVLTFRSPRFMTIRIVTRVWLD